MSDRKPVHPDSFPMHYITLPSQPAKAPVGLVHEGACPVSTESVEPLVKLRGRNSTVFYTETCKSHKVMFSTAANLL